MEVLQRTANRGSISTGEYEIANSLKTEADNSEYLYRVISSGGNRKTWTISAWVKRTELVTSDGGTTIFAVNVSGNEGCLVRWSRENANYYDAIQIDIGAGGTNSRSYTTSVYRDTSAWYHIVLAVDTTQSTATDRFKLYVNGVLITDYASRNNPAQNFDTSNNQAANSCTQHIGAYTSGGQVYGKHSGYFAEVHHIDGTAYAASDFGEYDDDSGIWKPKAFSGSYGTNGFYLDFEDNTSAGKDTSGNNNNFSDTNLNAADHATDTPTNNFCTMNPYAPYLYRIIATSDFTNGATQITKTNSNAWCGAIGTMGVKSGKWYYEARVNDNDNLMLGFSTFTGDTGANQSPHTIGTNIVWYGGNVSGSYWFYHIDSGSQVSNSSNRGTVWSNGDVLGVALDIDNSRIDFYVNGSLAGSPNTNVDISAVVNEIDSKGDFLIPFIGMWRSQFKLNFGGYTTHTISSAATDENGYGTFEYAPPSGYYALCTKNLAEYG